MTLAPVALWFAFIVFAGIAIAGALGMTTTMSMFRSGIFLMASFIGVAGLFILLLADLLALLQIMMYIGGMLVMILFMVLFAHDPGGAMMADMEMSPIERLFTRGIPPMDMQPGGHGDDMDHGERPHGDEMDHGGHAQHEEHGAAHGKHDGHGQDKGHGSDEHGGMDMSMTTPIKPAAAVLGALVGATLVALLVLRPAWPVVSATPDPRSAQMVGDLLMGKYMMAFEGAGLLILIGIFGAVFVSRPGRRPDASARDARVAVDAAPPPIEEDPLAAQAADEAWEPVEVTGIHADNPD